MSIIINEKNKIIIQGITGSVGRIFLERMVQYNTPLVGGVTPGKGGIKVNNLPVFNTVEEAVNICKADCSLIVVPASFVRDAVIEAVEAGIKKIFIYTEGVPVADALYFLNYAKLKNVMVVGPNSAGVISTGKANVSDIHDIILNTGSIGIVSKSGTLTYEVIEIIKQKGFGISTVVCLGGDPIIGMDYNEVIKMFNEDEETSAIILLGEIGGTMEIEAVPTIRKLSKPIIAYIAGQQIPQGKKMGHAGAIVTKGEDSAEAKNKILRDNGAIVVPIIQQIGDEIIRLKNEKFIVH